MRMARFVAVGICGLGIAGCQLAQDLQTDEAALVRHVLADGCIVGKSQSGSSGGGSMAGSSLQMARIRVGKVSKLDYYASLHSRASMKPSRMLVLSIEELADGWAVADVAYEGKRDNLYFNRQSGEFACSTDEWRAVNSAPQSRSFEKSPLILVPAPKAIR
ncbi:MAG: hypothetical protein NUV50_07645 [Rhodospirillales bacterium]|nr:hypothetical protein [Rhodospirillales bacterium]